MNDSLRTLLPENISGETAAHLVDFLFQLALAIESIYLGEILRYKKSIEIDNIDWENPPF